MYTLSGMLLGETIDEDNVKFPPGAVTGGV
jgi:hypothetical protein